LVNQVYSLEIIEELSIKAQKRLEELGYNNITVRTGDGHIGWIEHSPYDGIIVTAAAAEIPQSLIDQLRIGARLVIPVGLPYNYQELMVIEKMANGKALSRKISTNLKQLLYRVNLDCHTDKDISFRFR
jgi:protein-L-isoaspartate(D-aspartate) O-methyltransferase